MFAYANDCWGKGEPRNSFYRFGNKKVTAFSGHAA
jgi:hypothetical protein